MGEDGVKDRGDVKRSDLLAIRRRANEARSAGSTWRLLTDEAVGAIGGILRRREYGGHFQDVAHVENRHKRIVPGIGARGKALGTPAHQREQAEVKRPRPDPTALEITVMNPMLSLAIFWFTASDSRIGRRTQPEA